MNGRHTKSMTLDTPVLRPGDAVLDVFARPRVYCAPGISGGCRHGLKHSTACPHVADLAGLYNQAAPCHVNPMNKFGDPHQSMEL